MCMTNKECQKCETCGLLKYQLWVSPEMHDRGCPWGFDRMDRCPDAVNSAKRLNWMIGEGLTVSETGRAMVSQMAGAGVDLTTPPVEFQPWENENA